MVIHIIPVLVGIAKVVGYLVAMAFSAMFFLWPQNDRPTSKGQKIAFGIFAFTVFLFMFVITTTFSLR